MKKYTIIISALLLFFLILNTVAASDENATDLAINEEINEEISITTDDNDNNVETDISDFNSNTTENEDILELEEDSSEILTESSAPVDPEFKIKVVDKGYSYSSSTGIRWHNLQVSVISDNIVSKNVKLSVYKDNKFYASDQFKGERVESRWAYFMMGIDTSQSNNKIINFTILVDFEGDSNFLEVHLNKNFLLNNNVIQLTEDENFFEDDGTDDEYYRFTHPYKDNTGNDNNQPNNTETGANNTHEVFDDDYDDPIPINPNFIINIEDVEKGNPTIININADKNFTNQINLKIDEISIPINIINGTGNANTTLDVGNYTASINFNGNDNYLKSYVTKTFKVTQPKTDTTITITNETNTIKISLTSNNQPIKDAIINYTINNIPYTNNTDEKGEIKINGLTGNIEIKVIYLGNELYNPQNANSTFIFKTDETTNKTNETIKLNTKIISSDINAVYNTAKDLVLTLKNEKNDELANKQVIITINNIPYKRTTNSKGQITLAIPTNLAPNTYNTLISFNGDDLYKASTLKTKIVVKKAKPKIIASAKTFKVNVKNKKYTITLKNNKNQILKNTKVTLKVKGKTYTAKTNTKGKATFSITKLTKKGTFNAVIKYAGNKYYTAITKTAKIKITK